MAYANAPLMRNYFTRPGPSISGAATEQDTLLAGDERFGCRGVTVGMLYGFLREGHLPTMMRAQGFGSPRTAYPFTVALACTGIGLFAFPPASEHPLRMRHRGGAPRRGGSFVGPSPAPCNGGVALASLRRGGETPQRHASLASKPGGPSGNLLSPVFDLFLPCVHARCNPIVRTFLR